MASLANSTNHLKNEYQSQTFANSIRGGISLKLILQEQHYPIPKPGKDTVEKRKCRTVSPIEHRCKKPQPNIRKPNSTLHGKDHIS